jgi:hypothetical protein
MTPLRRLTKVQHVTVVALAAAVVYMAMNALADYLAVAPNGTTLVMDFMILPFFGLLLMILFIPIGLILLAFRRSRRVAALGLVGCIVFLAAVVGLERWNVGGDIRTHGFRRASQNAAPIIDAVKHYELAEGHPPVSLADLVPRYIASVPGTGIAAYPDFEYESGPNVASANYGNDWILWVDTPVGAINWDIFLYLPNQHYPQLGYDGYLERVDDWAYVHE